MTYFYFYNYNADIRGNPPLIGSVGIPVITSFEFTNSSDLSKRRSEKGYYTTDNMTIQPATINVGGRITDFDYKEDGAVIMQLDRNFIKDRRKKLEEAFINKNMIKVIDGKRLDVYGGDSAKGNTVDANWIEKVSGFENSALDSANTAISNALGKSPQKDFTEKKHEVYSGFVITNLTFTEVEDTTYGFDFSMTLQEVKYGSTGSSSSSSVIQKSSKTPLGKGGGSDGKTGEGTSNAKGGRQSIFEDIKDKASQALGYIKGLAG